MALNFPSSPNVGDQYTSGGVIWVWDGAKWTAGGISEAYLPLVGGTMSGPIMLPADPIANLQATTKQYVDAINPAGKYLPLTGGTLTGNLVGNAAIMAASGFCSDASGSAPKLFTPPPTNDSSNSIPSTAWVNNNVIAAYPLGDNRIINGDMRIDQRNNGATINPIVPGSYTVDRWQYQSSTVGKFAGGRAAILVPGFPYCFSLSSQSAYTPLAGDYFYLGQSIEADMVSDFAWGTPSAQPITFSFWVSSTLTGTFGGSINNNGATRSYPFTFPVTSTFTKVVITIPGDTAGTWTLSGNGIGLNIHFDLGAGSTFRGPAGAWASANYVGATGSVNTVATNGAVFNITGVKLEIGSVATPFNRQSLAKSLDDCRRYYQTVAGLLISGYNAASNAFYGAWPLSPPMRAAPTLTLSDITYGNASGLAQWNVNLSMWGVSAIITAAGTGGWVIFSATLAAEL